MSYGYDSLGRVSTRSVDAGNTTTFGFDVSRRPSTVANNLGTFTYGYADTTSRPTTISSPSSPITTTLAYYGNVAPAGTGNGDERLQQITNTVNGGVLSSDAYTYDPFGHIMTWTLVSGAHANPWQWNFTYDGADQLLGGSEIDTVAQTVQAQFGYGYDLAGNQTLAQSGNVPASGMFNDLNELGTLQTNGAGPLQVQGTFSKPVTAITVNSAPATIQPGNVFQATVPVTAGNNTVVVSGTDASNQQVTSHGYQVTNPAASTRTFAYDLNGNMTSDGLGRSYSWDAENRLASIAYTGTQKSTAFTYDGLGRMMSLTELNNGTVTSTRQFIWDGVTQADERDANNNVVRRYFQQGEQLVSGPSSPALLYYTRDHLGSVREAVDATGVVRARYDYDPYGVRTLNQITTNGVDTVFGYTGHMYYKAAADAEPAGLDLTLYRQYDPGLGRWLSRDPTGEGEGANLSDYAKNLPISVIDRLGLWGVGVTGGIVVEGGMGPNASAGGNLNIGTGIFNNSLANLAASLLFPELSSLLGDTAGGFLGGGAFFGPWSAVPCPKSGFGAQPWALGGTAGAGAGPFATNARDITDLSDPFATATLSTPLFSAQFSWGNAADGTPIWDAALTFGPSAGGALSTYPTSTVTPPPVAF